MMISFAPPLLALVLIGCAAQPLPTEERMREHLAWIAERTEYAVPETLPTLRYAHRSELRTLYEEATGEPLRSGTVPCGMYHRPDQQILIAHHAGEDSLVHELVHYMQHVHGTLLMRPREDIEQEATSLQAQWAAENGISSPC